MRVYAMDPGHKESALVVLDATTKKILDREFLPNDAMLREIGDMAANHEEDVLAIEKIEFMRQAVGAEVFDTVEWYGRFRQHWIDRQTEEARSIDWPVREGDYGGCYMVTRRQVKLHLCGTMQAKDTHIRQAVADVYGGVEIAKGTKKNPGPLFGISGHLWQALAVGITWIETALPFENGRPRYIAEAERLAALRS